LPATQTQRALATLPEVDPGDVFFDLEGSTYVGPRGLMFLFGMTANDGAGDQYLTWWAHDERAERQALCDVVDCLCDRLSKNPNMHIYHYGNFEPSVMDELAQRYRVRQRQVERLISSGVFVDLYPIVRDSVRTSQENMSLKSVEALYMAPRTTRIKSGEQVVRAYGDYLAIRGGDLRRFGGRAPVTAEQVLADIADYNRDDCMSTMGLRNWLVERRVEFEATVGYRLDRRNVVPSPTQRRTVASIAPTPVQIGTTEGRHPWLRQIRTEVEPPPDEIGLGIEIAPGA
jgi:uncharacterized protein